MSTNDFDVVGDRTACAAPRPEPLRFYVGQPVRKSSGYSFRGVVVSTFHKLDGQRRLVVECTVPGCEGMLHVFNEAQLQHDTGETG